jgi:hypothetical protein
MKNRILKELKQIAKERKTMKVATKILLKRMMKRIDEREQQLIQEMNRGWDKYFPGY